MTDMNQQQKKNKPLSARVRRYGLSNAEYTALLARQRGRCFGCQQPFSVTVRVNIDHDHKTNRVRGLLCQGCNAALGLVRESQMTLRRLEVYLNYDRHQIYVYIIGALKNPRVPEVGRALRQEGFEAIDDWFSAGPEADLCWQAYEQQRGHTFPEALHSRSAENVFRFDKSLIDSADIGVLVMPAGRSGHLELGYMAGQGKRTYILLDQEPEKYDVMPQFALGVTTSLDELIAMLKGGSDVSV